MLFSNIIDAFMDENLKMYHIIISLIMNRIVYFHINYSNNLDECEFDTRDILNKLLFFHHLMVC